MTTGAGSMNWKLVTPAGQIYEIEVDGATATVLELEREEDD